MYKILPNMGTHRGNSCRAKLIAEYGLNEDEDHVKIGTYHCNMLVISFVAQEGGDYSYCYRGVQLKPLKEI